MYRGLCLCVVSKSVKEKDLPDIIQFSINVLGLTICTKYVGLVVGVYAVVSIIPNP